MTLARRTFTAAGLWGIAILAPGYFAIDLVGRWYPPPVTHPDHYYGFLAVALAWQAGFLAIGRDPRRLRPLMIPAILEKASYVATLVVLYAGGRIELGQAAPAVPDFLLAGLFVAAYVRTGEEAPATTGARDVGTGVPGPTRAVG
jgi:hypothetical protein